MKKQKIFIVVGPTASGKSKLAIELAQNLQGQIVNADASQVYSGLRILTARPSVADEGLVPHYLYGYLNNHEHENVQGWLNRMQKLLPTLSNPVIVGGTGLYINALLKGMSPIPDIPPQIRSLVRDMPMEQVIEKLKNYDMPRDSQRRRRMLEVLLATGKTPSDFHGIQEIPFPNIDFRIILVQPERTIIYQRCADRLEQMFQMGAVDEVVQLRSDYADGGVMQAIGVKPICDYLDGRMTLHQAKEQTLLDTRHYAKRQMTWFRHQLTPNLVYAGQKIKDIITM